MAEARYTKLSLPLGEVTEKHYLARTLGCTGVGFSFVRYKPGQGGGHMHRHEVQEEIFATLKGNGTIIIDGERIPMPEGTIVRVSPEAYRAIGNDSGEDVIFLIVGGIPPKDFPPGQRTLFGDGIPDRATIPQWQKP
ncbi:MAG TPA: cupin domain-containing protein [Candidatus Acidoferrales bacterium]|nr:cupin domain-containing protein [Candidatus Acidoferrales bacterium]